MNSIKTYQQIRDGYCYATYDTSNLVLFNGYFNATKLCMDHGKDYNQWDRRYFTAYDDMGRNILVDGEHVEGRGVHGRGVVEWHNDIELSGVYLHPYYLPSLTYWLHCHDNAVTYNTKFSVMLLL